MSLPERQRSAFVQGGGGIGSVVVRDVAVPAPGPGEALVRLTAATLNYRDLIVAKGLLPIFRDTPSVPLSCAAGVVAAVGEGVTRVAVGDRVSPLFAQGWIDGPPDGKRMLGGIADGVARQYAAFEAESLLKLPDTIGDLEAATLPCAGLTAWASLFGERRVRPGEWVLLQGTGGVSVAALQLAHAAGARVAIASSSDAKLARARALGADAVANYRTDAAWAARLHDGMGGARAAFLVDVAGRDALGPWLPLLADDGVVAAVGLLASPASFGIDAVEGRPVVPIGVGNRAANAALLAFVAEQAVRPVVDVVYDLDRLPEALRRLEGQDFFGKVGVNLL